MRLTNSMHGFFLISDVEGQLSTVEQNLSKIRQNLKPQTNLFVEFLNGLKGQILMAKDNERMP